MATRSSAPKVLNYASPQQPSKAWGRGDWWLLAVVLAYGAVDGVLMLLDICRTVWMTYRTPEAMLAVSVAGLILVFPIQLLLRRRGVTWRSAVTAVIIFLGLVALNVWWAIGHVLSRMG